MLFVRSIILFVCWLLIVSSALVAKDTHCPIDIKWVPCIDGLKLRFGLNNYFDDIKIENIGNIAQKNKYINSVALLKNELFNNELFGNYQNGDGFQTPISLEFVENRFWRYFTRGFTFDLLLNSETTDLPPADEDSKVIQGSNGKIYLRHSDALTNLLETNFLEKEEISFTSEYPDYWALSADITKNAIVFGYSFGFFIGNENSRWFHSRFGAGLGVYAYDVTLNICSAYEITEYATDKINNKDFYNGVCNNKTEIDQARISGVYTTTFQEITIYESRNSDYIWRFLSSSNATGEGATFSSLKRHKSEISTNTVFDTIEFLSFTWRFNP